MARGLFITGTDTGVGKTLVAASFLRRFAATGLSVAGMKPIASGCDRTPDGLRNADALALLRESNCPVTYEEVNPYALEPAIAPHVAASRVEVTLELSRMIEAYRNLAARAAVVVVEGAGGWRVPTGPQGFLSDLPEQLGLEVVLVVGLRLGCLNHAFLTADAITRGGRCRLVGWVGNAIDPDMAEPAANVETLRERLPAPCLGIVPPLASPTPRDVAPLLRTP